MRSSYILATTYLDIAQRQYPEIIELANDAGFNVEEIVAQEYVDGELINSFFDYLSKNGMDSWLLTYAASSNISSHGPLGFAVLSSPDLYTALTAFADYQIIRTTSHSANFKIDGNRAHFSLESQTTHPIASVWLLETSFHVIKTLIETVVAHPLGNTARIRFSHPAPSYAQTLEDCYEIECCFDQATNSISFPASWCTIPSPLYDETNFRLNIAKCQELKLRFEEVDHATAVQIQLENAINERLCAEFSEQKLPSLDTLAESFSISPRTLHRQLKKHQTSYKQCLANARHRAALDLLKSTHLSIAVIADKLGYQESANFVRAFKKWSGTTPSAWRQSH